MGQFQDFPPPNNINRKLRSIANIERIGLFSPQTGARVESGVSPNLTTTSSHRLGSKGNMLHGSNSSTTYIDETRNANDLGAASEDFDYAAANFNNNYDTDIFGQYMVGS